MELDDLKKLNAQTEAPASGNTIEISVSRFKRRFSLHVWLETAVACLALIAVIVMIFTGHIWYALIVEQLLPQFASPALQIHPMMYLAMGLMALYCMAVPIKLHQSRFEESTLFTWSLRQRVESEIRHFEKHQRLWSAAPLWSFLPANIIGIVFFWGLQISLVEQWLPTPALLAYFAFLGLSTLAGFWLKKQTLEKQVAPILDELYQFQKELRE